jgi:hypothetical protein
MINAWLHSTEKLHDLFVGRGPKTVLAQHLKTERPPMEEGPSRLLIY